MHQAIDASRKGVADGRLVDAAEVRRRFGQSGTGAVFGSGSQKLAPVPDFPLTVGYDIAKPEKSKFNFKVVKNKVRSL